MTSRERISKVLNHEIPDFLPNGWGGCETAGLHKKRRTTAKEKNVVVR